MPGIRSCVPYKPPRSSHPILILSSMSQNLRSEAAAPFIPLPTGERLRHTQIHVLPFPRTIPRGQNRLQLDLGSFWPTGDEGKTGLGHGFVFFSKK